MVELLTPAQRRSLSQQEQQVARAKQQLQQRSQQIEEARRRIQEQQLKRESALELRLRGKIGIAQRERLKGLFEREKQRILQQIETQRKTLDPFEKQVGVAETRLTKIRQDIRTAGKRISRVKALELGAIPTPAERRRLEKFEVPIEVTRLEVPTTFGVSDAQIRSRLKISEGARILKFEEEALPDVFKQKFESEAQRTLVQALKTKPIFIEEEVAGKRIASQVGTITGAGLVIKTPTKKGAQFQIVEGQLAPINTVKVAPDFFTRLKESIKIATPKKGLLKRIGLAKPTGILVGTESFTIESARGLAAKGAIKIRGAEGNLIFTPNQASKLAELGVVVAENFVLGKGVGKLTTLVRGGVGVGAERAARVLKITPTATTLKRLREIGILADVGILAGLSTAEAISLEKTLREEGEDAALLQLVGLTAFGAGFATTGLKTSPQARKEFLELTRKAVRFSKKLESTADKAVTLLPRGKRGEVRARPRQFQLLKKKKKLKKKIKPTTKEQIKEIIRTKNPRERADLVELLLRRGVKKDDIVRLLKEAGLDNSQIAHSLAEATRRNAIRFLREVAKEPGANKLLVRSKIKQLRDGKNVLLKNLREAQLAKAKVILRREPITIREREAIVKKPKVKPIVLESKLIQKGKQLQKQTLGERFRNAQRQIAKLKITPIAIITTAQLIKQKVITAQKNLQSQKQRLKLLQIQKASQLAKQSQLQRIKLAEVSLLKAVQQAKQIERLRIAPARKLIKRVAPRRIPILFFPIIPPPTLGKPRKGKPFAPLRPRPIREPGHNVFIRSKGKFLKANIKPLTKSKARDLGAWITDRTTSRTFKTKKVDKPAQRPKIKFPRDYFGVTGRKWRGQIRKGIEQPIKKRVIERTTYAIDTLGEKKQLKAFREIARLKKKALRIIPAPKLKSTSILLRRRR